MSTSTIDGAIEEAVRGRRRGGLTVFKSLRFRFDGGSDRTMPAHLLGSPGLFVTKAGRQGPYLLNGVASALNYQPWQGGTGENRAT